MSKTTPGMINGDIIQKLETELAAAKELNAKLVGALECVSEGMSHDFHYACQAGLIPNCLCYGCQKARIKEALEAAKGKK